MAIERCGICKEFIFSYESKPHKCDPLWLCGIEDEEDDYCYEVHAFDAEEAAAKIAEDKDPDWDYSFLKSGGVKVNIKNPKTGKIKKFYVSAEHDIHYSASERKDE